MAGVLFETGVAFLALALAGALAHRLGQSVIPAYILAGVAVGPYVPTEVAGVSLALVTHGEFVTTAAELGIVLLLFFLGLEFDIGYLLSKGRELALLGGVDFLVNGAVGVALAYAFGLGPLGAVFVVGIVFVSSSAIVTKSLTDAGWLANPESRTILGTLVVEDIIVAVYLAVLAAIVGGGTLRGAALSVAGSFCFLAVLALVAYYGSDHVERAFDVGPDELFVLRVVGVAVAVGALALSVGVSEAVAAFFVGTAFSTTELVERIEHLVMPLRDVFAAVFFFAIGLDTDLRVVAGVALLVAVGALATTASKLASGYAGGRLTGLDARRSARVGIGLLARGEFSLIVATLAAASVVPAINEVVPPFAVGYVLVMSILGTLAIAHEGVLTSRLA
ncbi:CPA2 family monovalent cation:H+ antiporter-2 [Halarchaeum rubridurum]|uniref:CPA2 family monovalent cation:H+ antiporter-2 n=1 Tax=Halarchaeum rubridurum TaxID=489911 RepID=A0A830FP67_9EURY|nr:cation:proton antiporter [Halarchaeum rubridurum]MBP1954048.1 CPA2 family monovalent cation:H+ antiporter-2 [Halarchaeum rubridurum]GGM56935.1 transporter [Halarchaeum rubridurum]